jgi:hypothetical protein
VKVKAHVRLRSSALPAVALLALAMLTTNPVLAEGANAIDGNYRQSALREDVSVSQWQDSCGPAPKSQSSGGGETISVRTEGDEIVLVGGSRVYRSNECYELLPGLARDAHSRDPSGKSWRTRCSSPKNDPRRAVLQTSVTASEGRIDLYETGKYEVTVSDGHCTADIKRSRSYALIAKEAAPVLSATATAAATIAASAETPTKPVNCQSPGPAAKLDVTPARKLVRPGDTFQIRARVTDAAGCPIAGAGEPSWSVSESLGVHVDMRGKVRIDDTASSGTTEVIVSAHSKRAIVLVETTTPEKYEELLKISGLNAEGESALGSSITLEGKEEREVQAIDQGRTRRVWFGAILGALSLSLIGLYLVVARRAKHKAEALKTAAFERYKEDMHAVEAAQHAQEEVHRAQMNAHLASVAAREAKVMAQKAKAGSAPEPLLSPALTSSRKLACPVCAKEFAPPFQHCPNDGAKLVDESAAADASGHAFCPICSRGFASSTRVCPEHREELVPALPKANAVEAFVSERKAKICPTCGERSAGVSAFCGKDGTPLVLVN